MERYCVNCGSKMHEDAFFCSNCGKKASAPIAAVTVDETAEWGEFGNFLSRFCLILAKGFLFLIACGIIFICAASSGAALFFGGILLYNFATNGFYMLPSVLSSVIGIESISGIPLAFSGIALIFVALLFIILIIAVIRSIYNSQKRAKKTEK